MDGVANAYIRDLRLENVDEGISVTRSSFVTVSDITFTATSACCTHRVALGYYSVPICACTAHRLLWKAI
jgi:hypothetical protein